MNYYLGVDGGGSKTVAVVADETGRVIGRGTGGCGNHQIDAGLAASSIERAVDEALAQAGLGRELIRHAAFGLAGADREADFHILRPMLGKLGFADWQLVCDTVIALRAGTRQRDGIALICGSGTNCYGINAAGLEQQIGGFGYAFGDFGGGSELAVEAFRTVIRSWEGREKPTALTALALEALDYDSVEEMFHCYLDEGRRAPHTLAKILFKAAAHADEAARAILRRQGEELGKAAVAAIRRLGMENDSFDIVLAGSVLARGEGEYVTSHIERQVAGVAGKARLRRLGLEPAAGAVLLAMDKSGTVLNNAVYEQLQRELPVEEGTDVWALD